MAASTTTLTPVQTTDVQFRAWGSAISAKFAAVGWVQTADTGQINWTTVTFPTLANTAQGYEIWGMNDTLQATAPVYLKLEYGSGAAATNPGMWFTWGTGTNGSGALTGPVSTRQQWYSSPYSTNAMTCYFSGSTNYFVAALFTGPATGVALSIGFLFSFERTKAVDGADTSQGTLTIFRSTTGNAWSQMFWDRTIGNTTNSIETSLGAMGAQNATTAKNGTQVAVYPFFLCNAGIFLNPPTSCLAFYGADIIAYSTITFTIYGSAHTYMPLSVSSFTGANLLSRASTANVQTMMIRYE